MKRARSTAAPRPHRRASHRAGPIRCRTRLADRTKRPSGPGTLGHHSPVVSVGPSDQTRRPYNRGRAARAPPLVRTPLVTAAVFRVCRSSNSRRRSGAAPAPATAVSRLLVVNWNRRRACSAGARSVSKRSLVSSSPAAPRAPQLLMPRRRAPATACPCAGAAGAGGCPLLCWR